MVLLFLETGDGVSMNTEEWAQKKTRHAVYQLKSGNPSAALFPNFFPVQGGLPIKVDGQTIGAIAASGAKSEVDEAIAKGGIDALLKK